MQSFDNIPVELREIHQWVVRDERKVPYNPITGQPASSTDPTTWDSYENAIRAYQTGKYAGIGFVFTESDPYVGVDYDHIRETEGWEPGYLEEILSFGSYAELSPSGTGAHVITKGMIPGQRNRNASGPREMYEKGRYFTFTGNIIAGACPDIRQAQDAINTVYRIIDPSPATDPSRKTHIPTPASTPGGNATPDYEIIRKAESAKNGDKFSRLMRGDWSGYPSQSEGDSALCCLLAFYTRDIPQIDRIFRISGLNRPKWGEKHGALTYGESTIQNALSTVKEQSSSAGYKNPRQQVKTHQEKPRDTHTPQEKAESEPEIQEKALNILENGDPLEYFRTVYRTIHSGNTPVLDTILFAGVVQAALTTVGIQPDLSGQPGSGKTSSAKAAIHLFPEEYVLKVTFSNKALFYHRDLKPGCLIFSDDTELSQEIEATIKVAMSNFQENTEHLTVVNAETRLLKIPPRQMFVFTSVGDTGGEQLNDRQYKISIDPSTTDEDNFDLFLKERMKNGTEKHPINEGVLVCRQILRIIKDNIYAVKIPFSDRIKFSDKRGKRDMELFYDFVMAATILKHKQRNTAEGEDSILWVTAEEEDFHTAREVFKANADTRTYKLTKEEKALLDYIISIDLGMGVPEPDLISQYANNGKKKAATRTNIRRLLYGRPDRGGEGGLCSKIPGFTAEMTQCDNPRGPGKRNCNVIFAPEGAKSNLYIYGDFVTLK